MIGFVADLLISLKIWNRRRLCNNRIRKVLSSNSESRQNSNFPEKLKRVLIVDGYQGWGDFLYHLGLIRDIATKGIMVDVATVEQSIPRYTTQYVEKVFSIEDDSSIEDCCAEHYDLCIDLTYVNLNAWEKRLKLLRKLSCYSVTVGDVTAHSSFYSEYVDISTCAHQSERMAKIYNRIFNEGKLRVFPVYCLEKVKKSEDLLSFEKKISQGRRLVYVNAVAQDADRCLSEQQVRALVSLFVEEENVVGVFNSPFKIDEQQSVLRLPKLSFDNFALFLRECDAVITTDTSVTHLASAFNVPALVFFCGNDRDYFPKYAMSDVWAPLSQGSCFYKEDDPRKSKSENYFLLNSLKDVSEISVGKVRELSRDFLRSLR